MTKDCRPIGAPFSARWLADESILLVQFDPKSAPEQRARVRDELINGMRPDGSTLRIREVDHLVPLELGGNNDIANLWPEAAYPAPGFHEKDKVENYLHDQVCSGAIPMKEAQIEIATNWLAVYHRMSTQY